VEVVLNGCKPEGLAALALTSCDFIDDLTAVSVTRELPLPPSEQVTTTAAGQGTALSATFSALATAQKLSALSAAQKLSGDGSKVDQCVLYYFGQFHWRW